MIGGDFKRKKIESLTLGERMKKIRSERRLGLYEISRATKVQVKYLEYLENGEYQKMPADVYVKGFLKNYADFAGINEKLLIKLYERERGIHRNIKKIDESDKSIEPIKLNKWIITPQFAAIFFVIFFLLAGIFYLYKEIDTFISSPRLIIFSPQDAQNIDGNNVIVKGSAEKDSIVTINDQVVPVNENGDFSQEIGLHKGLNPITVKAKNKFDKYAEKTLSVHAEFESPNSQNPDLTNLENPSSETSKLTVEITAEPGPVWLSVKSDDNLVFSGTLNPGTIQKVEAKDKVSITSAKGNQTHIKINGKDLGILSPEVGIIKDIEFTADKKY
jgi:cytoskeletal protein RodZ